jgi:hypothetical protein
MAMGIVGVALVFTAKRIRKSRTFRLDTAQVKPGLR